MTLRIKILLVAFCLLLPAGGVVHARLPIRESESFQQYLKKPRGEFAKLVCLLNYYRTGDFVIRFDGFDYVPSFVFPHAKAWLFTHYNKDTASQWIRKNCYVSPFERNIIYVKSPDGEFEPARDMILRDLAELERTIAEIQTV